MPLQGGYKNNALLQRRETPVNPTRLPEHNRLIGLKNQGKAHGLLTRSHEQNLNRNRGLLITNNPMDRLLTAVLKTIFPVKK